MNKSKSKNLHLHLTFEYFDQIERGEKKEEYRLVEKWEKKIEGREFENVVLWRAFQKGRFIKLPWRGCVRKTITHPHFGKEPVEVYAIYVGHAQQSGQRNLLSVRANMKKGIIND